MTDGQFLETLVDEIGEALVSWTVCGEIATWNKAAEKLLGYRGVEVIGRNAALVVPAELIHEHDSLMDYLTQRGSSAELSTVWRHANGDLVKLSLSLSRLCDPEGQVVGVGCVLRPDTETARLIDRLRRRAHTDTLTGALNRAGVEDLLACPERYRGGAHRAVLFIDLDGFKQVNDLAGHRCGDQLLKACADRIRQHLAVGHSVARWGGDEFVVILEDLPRSDAESRWIAQTICNELLDALRPDYLLGNRPYRCPASIGACVYQPLKTAGYVALEIADKAMYQLKASRKNAYKASSALQDEPLRALVTPSFAAH